jgi:uncharacterized protein (TIGR02996 family)
VYFQVEPSFGEAMSDEKALLAAIWAEPHDDNARLVYADWLQETGEPVKAARAEFIRLQCEANRLDEFDPRRVELSDRAEALRKKHSGKWKGKVTTFVRQAKYVRGFPYPERQVRVCRFTAIPASEWDEVPLWGIVLVQHSRKSFVPIPDSPHLARVGRLALTVGDWSPRYLHQDDAARLVQSPHLRNLEALDVYYMPVGPEPFVALAGAPPLPNLRSLRGAHCACGPALAALVASDYPSQLESLIWQYNGTPASHVGELFRAAGRFTRLRSLAIHVAQSGGTNLAGTLAACGPFPELRSLDFFWERPPDEVAAAVATWPGLARVRRLTLSGLGGVTLVGARALINSPHAPAEFEMLDCRCHYGARPAIVKMLRDRFGPGVRDEG